MKSEIQHPEYTKPQSFIRRHWRKLLIIVAILGVFAASPFPFLFDSIDVEEFREFKQVIKRIPFNGTVTRTSNCGGNSAALSRAHMIAIIAQLGASDAPDHLFRITAANAEQREELNHLARSHWLPGARFLVSTAPITARGAQPRRIIVVCDTPYRNVPQRWIGSAPPTHAAAFSDGSCRLISLKEFTALDRSTFVPLDECFPPKTK